VIYFIISIVAHYLMKFIRVAFSLPMQKQFHIKAGQGYFDIFWCPHMIVVSCLSFEHLFLVSVIPYHVSGSLLNLIITQREHSNVCLSEIYSHLGCISCNLKLSLSSFCHTGPCEYRMQLWRQLSTHSNLSPLKIGISLSKHSSYGLLKKSKIGIILSWCQPHGLLKNNSYIYASGSCEYQTNIWRQWAIFLLRFMSGQHWVATCPPSIMLGQTRIQCTKH
jgi:hypothetical protein